MANKDLRYIYDVSKGKFASHSWSVRFNNCAVIKLFNFAEYGGKEKAYQAAVKWRDERYEKINGEPINPDVRYMNNSSGYNGVTVATKIRGSGKTYKYYVASCGDNKTKTFSVNKYGEEEAFRLAVQARKAINRT